MSKQDVFSTTTVQASAHDSDRGLRLASSKNLTSSKNLASSTDLDSELSSLRLEVAELMADRDQIMDQLKASELLAQTLQAKQTKLLDRLDHMEELVISALS